jgi:hypothetical protein
MPLWFSPAERRLRFGQFDPEQRRCKRMQEDGCADPAAGNMNPSSMSVFFRNFIRDMVRTVTHKFLMQEDLAPQ